MILLVGSAASGCDYIPGTDAYKQERAQRLAADLLLDPTSAQFRNVVVKMDSVCGELNGKNRMGAYVGFTRFVVETSTGDAQLDPEFDHSTLASAQDLCTSMLSNSYSSSASTTSACEMAAEERLKQVLQSQFDTRWDRQCGEQPAREVFRPNLSAPAAPASGESQEGLKAVEAAADAALANAAESLTAATDALEDAGAEDGMDVGWMADDQNVGPIVNE